MDEQQTNHTTEPEEDLVRSFQEQREKKIENFLLDFQTDDSEDDAEATGSAHADVETDLNSYRSWRFRL